MEKANTRESTGATGVVLVLEPVADSGLLFASRSIALIIRFPDPAPVYVARSRDSAVRLALAL